MKRIFTICLLSLFLLSGASLNAFSADAAAPETQVKNVAGDGKVDDSDNFDFKQVAMLFTEIEENLKTDNLNIYFNKK